MQVIPVCVRVKHLMIQKVVYANEICFPAIFLPHPHTEHCPTEHIWENQATFIQNHRL